MAFKYLKIPIRVVIIIGKMYSFKTHIFHPKTVIYKVHPIERSPISSFHICKTKLYDTYSYNKRIKYNTSNSES